MCYLYILEYHILSFPRCSINFLHIFKIKPPFVSRVRFAIADYTIHLDNEAVHEWCITNHPAYHIMNRSLRFIPWTNLDTSPAGSTILVGHPELGTALGIERPGLITIVYSLFTGRNSFRGAFYSTLLTFSAELLQPEINQFVGEQGKISGHGSCFKAETKEWV